MSLYSLAVNIHPDELAELQPRLSAGRKRLLARLSDDPRLFLQIALVFKSFTLILITLMAIVGINALPASTHISSLIWYLIIVAAVWLVYLVVVELLPRRASRRAIKGHMISFWWLLAFVYAVFYPIVVLYRRAIKSGRETEAISEDEKEELIERAIDTLAEQAGITETLVESDEKEMIGQIFQLDQTVVREIMVPRIEISALRKDATLAEIQELVRSDGHSRYPVYDETIDNVIGILYIKDLFSNLPACEEDFTLTAFLREPMVVPELKVIGELLREFRLKHVHLALVVDEYGGLSGLVTLEDILEEIVGEIQDEHDTEEPEFAELPDGSYRVDANMLIDDLLEKLDVAYEHGDFDTVGGLIYDLVGSVPEQGAVLTWHDLEFEVEQVEGQRIEWVRIRRREAET
ncbi:MAG: HlyC/CorC family transporter [Candidatus Zixiibacteriota bacterium]|nr:MAG: HlyC/CorC family transporter [candidate division Zixibacteria bacterium]